MAKACERGRCPARADVEDHKTTEYRRGCRLQPCRTAHTLAAQRSKASKAIPSAVIVQLSDRAGLAAALSASSSTPTGPDSWDAFDVVAAVRADLADLTPTHPLHRSLSAMALALANQLQMSAGGLTSSASGAARQLAALLDQLAPAKDDDSELDAFLANLLSDDDDADQPAG